LHAWHERRLRNLTARTSSVIRFRAAARAALLLAGLAAPAAAQTEARDVLKESHGNWEIRCIEDTDVCAMSQVGKTLDGKRALLVTIQRLEGATAEDGAEILGAITMQAPLGVLIPYGVRLKVDDNKVVRFPISRCVPGGCVSQAPMLEEAVNDMKRGTTAIFGFFLDHEILVSVSLRGFTAAFDGLTPVSAPN